MQCVILAAGRGTRMGDLTKTTPKPMLTIKGKTLLEWKFDILPPEVDEIIILVGYLGDVIRNAYGNEYKGRKITYVEQHAMRGSGEALWLAKPFLKKNFLVLMGDDLYSKEDIANLMLEEWALLVAPQSDAREGGRVLLKADNSIEDIIEGEHAMAQWWANTSAFKLDTRIFHREPIPKSVGSNELGLPQSALYVSREFGIPFRVVFASWWMQITSPEDIVRAEQTL